MLCFEKPIINFIGFFIAVNSNLRWYNLHQENCPSTNEYYPFFNL